MNLDGNKIVPVVVIDDSAHAVPLAHALLRGGISCAEITLRTSAARHAIEYMSTVESFLVGAGTVITASDVDAAAEAGAGFVVSPGLDAGVIDRCRLLGLPVFPGVATPSEIQRAKRFGLTQVKLFPSELLGGITFIAAMRAPFPDMEFLPTGGVDERNILTYMEQDGVFAVGGSWIAPRELIAEGAFDEIETRARAATKMIALKA